MWYAKNWKRSWVAWKLKILFQKVICAQRLHLSSSSSVRTVMSCSDFTITVNPLCHIEQYLFWFFFSNHAVEITFQQNVPGAIWIITLSPGKMIKCVYKVSKQCGKGCVYYDLSVWFYKCEVVKPSIIHCGLTIDAQVLCKYEKKRKNLKQFLSHMICFRPNSL